MRLSNIAYTSIGLISAAILFTGVPILFAQTNFTQPTDFPPKGNVPPPINTGSDAQAKAGQLTVNKLCLKTSDPANCKDIWPAGGLTSIPTLQQVTDAGKSTTQTVELKGGVRGTQTDKWTLSGNTSSTDSAFIEFWGTNNSDATRRGELTLGGYGSTGGIKFYNYSGTWNPPLVTIAPNGNVDVSGTVKAKGLQLTTGAGAGKVLTSDASGIGTWTTPSAPSITWGNISGFPSGCLSGQYVEAIGGTLTCKALPTKVPWSSLTFPICPSGYAVGFYTDTGNLDCGAPVSTALTGSGTGSTIAKFTGGNTLGDSRVIEDTTRLGLESIYVGGNPGDPGGTPRMNLTVSRDLIVYGTMTKGNVPWARLSTFPAACPAGQYVTAVGGTLTCSTPSGGGAGLPTGTTGQTLRHNGTAWVADSTIKNDGTKVVITATSSDSVALDVGGGGAPKKIANVATPTVSSDAATKEYVDARVGAQTGGGGSWLTYTSYGVAANDQTPGKGAPACKSGWTDIFQGWGPLTGEAAYLDVSNMLPSSAGGRALSILTQNRSTNSLMGVLNDIASLLSDCYPCSGGGTSVPVSPFAGGFPVMAGCFDLPIGAKGPMGLGIFLGNEKEYLPGNTGDSRQNWTIGALVPSGWHPDSNTTIYNTCRICAKKF